MTRIETTTSHRSTGLSDYICGRRSKVGNRLRKKETRLRLTSRGLRPRPRYANRIDSIRRKSSLFTIHVAISSKYANHGHCCNDSADEKKRWIRKHRSSCQHDMLPTYLWCEELERRHDRAQHNEVLVCLQGSIIDREVR